MKIVIPNFPLPDSFVDNVKHTLQAMGHEVSTPPAVFDRSSNPALRFVQDAWRKANPQRLTQAETWILQEAKQSKFDLVLCLTQSFREEVLADLKRAGVTRRVAWWGDTPANMQGFGLLADGWDVIFLKDQAAVKKFVCLGLDAEHLHEAMNPDWHRKCYTAIGEDVAIAGNYYGYRQFLVDRLMRAGIRMSLYGANPPRWAKETIKRSFQARYIVKDEKSRVFGSALACLNSTALSEGDSLNCRAFEIAGAGGLQLIENKPSVAQCFEPGAEVLTYDRVEDIVGYLERARREPDWARSIRDAGHDRAHAHHTYRHRLTHLLKRAGL